MIRFEDLLEKVEAYHPEADLDVLRRAYIFSAREHRGQLRKSGEIYLSHPLEVANILAEMKLDVVTVSVGLLHDVVEDTLTTIDTIKEYFGEEIAHLVEGLTKISKISFASKRQKQAENFRKMLLAMVDDIRVILLKLADRLHNMRTLEHLEPQKRVSIAEETLEIYSPIAHRLGMGRIRSELEDLAFSYIDPQTYQNLLSQLEQKRHASDEFIGDVKKIIEKRLKEHNIHAEINSRIKRIVSIYQKMKRQHITLDQVYDLIALRIITDTTRDCYAILGIVHNTWKPVPGRIKDYVAMPRPNMYQSLHTSVISNTGVPFEIQIRTREMDRIAEEGIAAHWKYKEGRISDDKDDQRFTWLRHLLEWQQEVKDPHQFMSNLKIDLYPEEVYAFTPNGEVITLPRDATPVDFAYSIHTEIGHHCTGAKVNGRMVNLRYKLRNGEICEIITSKDQGPSRDWLSFVKTSRAKNRIRHWLNVTEKERSLELGKKLLEREARRYKLSLKKLYENEVLEEVFKEYGVSKMEDLLSAIGFGKFSARQVLFRMNPSLETQNVEPEEAAAKESKITSVVRRVLGRGDSPIVVKGSNDMLVYLAKCCNPISGEEIAGYITRGKGISVHSVNCPNMDSLLTSPDRRIEVQWAAAREAAGYTEKLTVHTQDRQGVLADITKSIADIQTNIRDIRAVTNEERQGVIDITVEVKDIQQLHRVIQHIKEIKGVFDVERRHRSA